MKKSIVVLVALSSLSASANTFFPHRWPDTRACGFGVSYDSFGRGIEDGFKGSSLRAKMLDETCYGYGVDSGKATRASDTWSFCTTAFDRGRAEGYSLNANDPGDECNAQGNKAGEAALDIDAREGSAPSECQNEYDRGKRELRDGLPQSNPDGNVPAHCYNLGRWDASAGL